MYRFIATITAALILAAPVASQETTTVDEARAAIADLRDWPPDFDSMTKRLAKGIKKGKKGARKFFKDAGELERIEFWETFGGQDLYLLYFQNSRAGMRFARDADGKIAAFRIRGIGWR